jgi:hypothetical protein
MQPGYTKIWPTVFGADYQVNGDYDDLVAAYPPATNNGKIAIVTDPKTVLGFITKNNGLYICNGINWNLMNLKVEFTDDTLLFRDDVDTSKKLAFQLSPISTNTTRILTMANADKDLQYVGNQDVSSGASPTFGGANISGVNADKLDGFHAADFATSGHTHILNNITAMNADYDAGNYKITALRFESDVATGTAPFTVASTTVVSNLNADLLDGNEAAAFALSGHNHVLSNLTAMAADYDAGSYKFQALRFESDVATGTSPLVVASTTVVSNLNADYVDGVNIASLTNTRLLRYNATGTKIENATITESSGALGSITTIGMSGQLTSTLAIGTSPFAVTSTTVNTNLNADLVDGKNETDFALLAGRSSGQTLNGGIAASEKLILSSTAHATKGNIQFCANSTYDCANIRLGIGTLSPTTAIEVSIAGTAKSVVDFLTLTNTVNAADMDATGTGLLFRQYYYDAVTPAVKNSGRISVRTETDWTSTAATQDSFMGFWTCLNGTLTEIMILTSTGILRLSSSTAPTSAYLDLNQVGNETNMQGWLAGDALNPGIFDFQLAYVGATNDQICSYRFGLSSNSTGANRIMLYNPNGTNIQHRLSSSGDDGNGATYFCAQGGGVVIGATALSNASCLLELSSTTGAFVPPRMTTTQRNAMTAINGMMIYNTTTAAFNVRIAGAWVAWT